MKTWQVALIVVVVGALIFCRHAVLRSPWSAGAGATGPDASHRGDARDTAGTVLAGQAGAPPDPAAPPVVAGPLPTTVAIEKMTPVRRQGGPLNLKSIPLRVPNTETVRETSVELEYRLDDTRALARGRDGDRPRNGHLAAFRLYSTDPAVPFEWYYVGRETPSNFRLLVDNSGAPYLTWSEGGMADLAAITAPRDLKTALDENARLVAEGRGPTSISPGFVCVPATGYMPRSQVWGANAVTPDTSVLSVVRGKADDWEVQVSGVDHNKVFTFVSPDGKQWSLKGGAPPAPAK